MSIIMKAPMSGKLVPLEELPDPVFAEKLLGDGIAILPDEGIVESPFDGSLIALPASGHACGILTDDQIELIIHIGIDTVEMEGRGFRTFANRGDHVYQGQKLIEFNLSTILEAGKSPLSPIIVSGAEVKLHAKGNVLRGDPLLEIIAEDNIS